MNEIRNALAPLDIAESVLTALREQSTELAGRFDRYVQEAREAVTNELVMADIRHHLEQLDDGSEHDTGRAVSEELLRAVVALIDWAQVADQRSQDGVVAQWDEFGHQLFLNYRLEPGLGLVPTGTAPASPSDDDA